MPLTESCSECSKKTHSQDTSQCQAYDLECSFVSRCQAAGNGGQPPASFLCFLPEFRGRPSLFQTNGSCENNSKDFLSASSSLSITRKRIQRHDIPIRTIRSVNVATVDAFNNGYHNMKATSGSSNIQEVNSDVRHTDMRFEDTHEQTKDEPQSAYEGLETSNEDFSQQMEESADSQADHKPVREDTEVQDDLAYEITEFFEAFQEGHDRFQRTLLQEPSMERISEEAGSTVEPSMIMLTTSDSLSGSDKLSYNVPNNEESNNAPVTNHENNPNEFLNGGKNNSFLQTDDVHVASGKWYDDVEAADSVSVTFSGPLALSGPMSYTGHSVQVPYSGSLSHRSDSSTASTHSFAFPILPCEWNSSPVKMAQPDKRYMRPRWRRRLCSLFCCDSSATLFN